MYQKVVLHKKQQSRGSGIPEWKIKGKWVAVLNRVVRVSLIAKDLSKYMKEGRGSVKWLRKSVPGQFQAIWG